MLITFLRNVHEGESYVWNGISTSFQFTTKKEFFASPVVKIFKRMDGFMNFHLLLWEDGTLGLGAMAAGRSGPNDEKYVLGTFQADEQLYFHQLNELLSLPLGT